MRVYIASQSWIHIFNKAVECLSIETFEDTTSGFVVLLSSTRTWMMWSSACIRSGDGTVPTSSVVSSTNSRSTTLTSAIVCSQCQDFQISKHSILQSSPEMERSTSMFSSYWSCVGVARAKYSYTAFHFTRTWNFWLNSDDLFPFYHEN